MDIQNVSPFQIAATPVRARGPRPAERPPVDGRPGASGGFQALRRLYHVAQDVLSPREMGKLQQSFERFNQIENPSREQYKSFYDHVTGFIQEHAGDPGDTFNPRPLLHRIMNFAAKNLDPREQTALKEMVERFMKAEDKTPEQMKHFLREAISFVKDHAGDGRPRVDLVA